MKIKHLIILSLVTCFAQLARISYAQLTHPNLFLFIADDLSKTDLGVTGNKFVKTPTIDAFANKAISFTNMYTASAMCAPARSALYTGLYPHRNGCHMNHGYTKKDVITLPVYLKNLGYKVALVHKTHIKPATVYPFDYVAKDSLEIYLNKTSSPLCVIFASKEPHGPHKKDAHSPDSVNIPPKWLDTQSTRNTLAGYYADIAELDKEFSDFLNLLSAHKLQENAVTIFTSDHGHGFFAKWSCYEAGLQIPFYVQSNGITFKSKKINQLTSFIDVLPTFIELAGGKIPDSLDGKSLLTLLNGETIEHHKYIFANHTNRGIISGKTYPIRSITDGKWKYIRNLCPDSTFQNIITNGRNFETVVTNKNWQEWLDNRDTWKWVDYYQKRPHEELYNLERDPNEMNNLANKDEYEKIQKQLSKELTAWMKRQGDAGIEAELKVPLRSFTKRTK